MQISDAARGIIVTYVRSRLDGHTALLRADALGERTGQTSGAVGAALEEVSRWCASYGLPDISSSIVDPDQAEHNVMLPAATVVDRLGGEAAARSEQARVRDYDWAGWLDS